MALFTLRLGHPASVLDFPWTLGNDLVLSIEYFLKTQQYERNNITQTIFQRFADSDRKGGSESLTWDNEFPDDIAQIHVPLLAIDSVPDMSEDEYNTAAGGRYISEPREMTIWGFAGGETGDSTFKNNSRQMGALMEDLKRLITAGKAGLGYIDLIHFDDAGTPDTSIEVSAVRLMDVSAQVLGAVGATDAERYRFRVDFVAQLLTSNEE